MTARSNITFNRKRLVRTAAFSTLALAGLAVGLIPSSAAQASSTAGTELVKVSYSIKVYKLVNGVATPLTMSQWQLMGSPLPKTIGNIPGTRYIKYGTSLDVIATPPYDTPHKLTFKEWNSAGQPAPTMFNNEGFIKLSWGREIARMTNLGSGAGHPLTFGEWAANGFTSYASQQRITGDQFYKYPDNPTVYYAGPGVNRAINFNEWLAAGKPTPGIRGQVAATAASTSPWGLIRPVSAGVTSEFSLARMHPTLGYVRPHLGIDLSAACGTPIKAARSGVVSVSTYSGGGGNMVTINHGIVNGVPLFTSYMHMGSPGVPVGSVVNQGSIIGYVGSTGESTGCHLHFEVKPNNQAKNPRGFLTF